MEPTTLYDRTTAIRTASELARGDRDGWTYTIEARDMRETRFAVVIKDAQGELVGYWGS